MLEAILIIASYLIGSIPSAYIAGKIFKGIDIRKVGDGNVGAANVYREIGWAAGVFVLLFDVGKGAAVIILTQAYASQWIVLISGAAVVLGHTWSIFIGFKGGRGEATASGVLVILFPQAMLILAGIALVPFILTRNTMLLGAILFAPLWLAEIFLGASGILIGYSIIIPCIVGINHYFTTRHLSLEIKKRSTLMR